MQRRPQMTRRPSVGGKQRPMQIKSQPRLVFRQAPKQRPQRKPGS